MRPTRNYRIRGSPSARITGLGANSQIAIRHLNTDVVETRAARHVVAEIVLLLKFRANLFEDGCDGVLLRNIERTAAADVGKRFECVRIDQELGTDRDEVQQDG